MNNRDYFGFWDLVHDSADHDTSSGTLTLTEDVEKTMACKSSESTVLQCTQCIKDKEVCRKFETQTGPVCLNCLKKGVDTVWTEPSVSPRDQLVLQSVKIPAPSFVEFAGNKRKTTAVANATRKKRGKESEPASRSGFPPSTGKESSTPEKSTLDENSHESATSNL